MKKLIFTTAVFFALASGLKSTALYAESGKAEKKVFEAAFAKRLPAAMLQNISSNYREFVDDVEALLKSGGELFVLADKKHFLKEDFVPADLLELKTNRDFTVSKAGMYASKIAVDALHKMGQAANKASVTLVVASAYRSYRYQKSLFARYASQYGESEAECFSARAGTSQHQLGTVFDFGSVSDAYAQTKAGKWLAENAAKFGFSLSFPQGYEKVTGYKWECWHFRYIGVQACEMQRKWFSDIQQYMLEVLHWYQAESSSPAEATS